MADVNLTYANLIAALADNTTGNITPNTIRNLVVSLAPYYYSVTATGGGATIASAGTYVKMNTVGQALGSAGARGCSSTAGNKILHNDSNAVRRVYDVRATISFNVTGTSKSFSWAFALNGTVVSGTAQTLTTSSTSGNNQTVTLTAQIPMSAATDYIEVWVTNNTDTTAPNVTGFSMSAVGHIY